MQLSLIAKELELSYEGEAMEIRSMNDLEFADASQLSFISDVKHTSQLSTTKAGVVLVPESLVSYVPSTAKALIIKGDVHLAMARVSKLFSKPDFENAPHEAVIGKNSTIAPTAFVDAGAIIGDNVTLMPGVFVGAKAKVGDDSILYPNVTVYRECVVGKSCIIHAGSVIGSDGYGFAHTALGEHVKIYQNGNVVLEDKVEIGSNSSIDRAVFNTTLIKTGTKLDNLVHIAHNCEIGEHSLITASVIFAGSTKVGRNFVAAGQAGIEGHIEIAPFTTVAAKAGVTKDVKESHTTIGGFPHMPQRQWLKLQAKLARLLKA